MQVQLVKQKRSSGLEVLAGVGGIQDVPELRFAHGPRDGVLKGFGKVCVFMMVLRVVKRCNVGDV